ncbi:hypothetical protein ACJBU6_00451 [Exserohilum turcicum]
MHAPPKRLGAILDLLTTGPELLGHFRGYPRRHAQAGDYLSTCASPPCAHMARNEASRLRFASSATYLRPPALFTAPAPDCLPYYTETPTARALSTQRPWPRDASSHCSFARSCMTRTCRQHRYVEPPGRICQCILLPPSPSSPPGAPHCPGTRVKSHALILSSDTGHLLHQQALMFA